MSADAEKVPPEAFFNRELSWLSFARRVLALVENRELPLLERVKFAGIMGMLHDEFFMKRVSGLKRRMRKGSKKTSLDGMTSDEQYRACRKELNRQIKALGRLVQEELRPAMADEGIPLSDVADLSDEQREAARAYFRESVLPILTPLAVDTEHPFPFISNLGLNVAVMLPDGSGSERFVRIKVPGNRPRWVPVGDGASVPLEQVIAFNLDLLFDLPDGASCRHYVFRVTRGAKGEPFSQILDDNAFKTPGSIVQLVGNELKARRFAGVVRLEVDANMPKRLRKWLQQQLDITKRDVDRTGSFLGLTDLLDLKGPKDRPDLHLPPHLPKTHPRLRNLNAGDSRAIFERIAFGDILLYHPYHSFDTSVLRFLQAAAIDPDVLAIKLTIYRTSTDSPIVHALAEAARQGKQVAVLVEITARFDEAPNIAWGKFLENEGVHVAYGVQKLKTHVKAALVVREEKGKTRLYAHVGTGNYHTGTARVYEDLGILTADRDICSDVAHVFNELTGAAPYRRYRRLLVAPHTMRKRFTRLIRREAENARAGRPAGIEAKMNQLQDPKLIRELYDASQAGVPVRLHVRGLCCLRPGVPGLSENIRVSGVVGRFLEHSRIYRFENAGDPEFFIGSADWMRRNLNRRVETVTPVLDPLVKAELDDILRCYREDNASAWDCLPDGTYVRRSPADGEAPRRVQELLAHRVPPEPEPPVEDDDDEEDDEDEDEPDEDFAAEARSSHPLRGPGP